MHRSLLALLPTVAVALALCSAPAEAQSATARMTASVTVVERVGLSHGTPTATAAPGAAIDLSAPLLVQGRVPVVVKVFEGGDAERSRGGAPVLRREPGAGGGDAYRAELRVPLAGGGGEEPKASLVYVVATIN